MEFSLLIQNTLELWKEWEMRLLVLLSLFLQVTLATQVSQRKYKFRIWIHVMVWTAYTLADSITNLALGIFSNRLANIKGLKGTIDPKTQITAFWAPFLLLHLGGPDTITAFVKEDNELWLRQFLRLCIQVGLVGFIYYMALSGSTLSMLAAGMILVGLMKYAERILCLYLASNGKLRESMLSLPDSVPIYHRIMEQYTLKKEEGYRVAIDKVCEVPAREDLPTNTDRVFGEDMDTTLYQAYELFKVFKLLFLGLIRNSVDLEASKRMFMNPRDMDSVMAFGIVEIELGFMYDLLYTKVPLLNCTWGTIRWGISLSVPCAMLVFFSLQDKKDYAKVDVCITFLLISVAIIIEIYSLLLATSSDWVNHWRLQRPRRSTFSSAVAFLQLCPNRGWSTSVAQISLLKLSTRKINRIFLKCPILAKLNEIFDVDYIEFKSDIKERIFHHIKNTVTDQGRNNGLKSFKQVVSNVLKGSNNYHLLWSVEEKEFDQSILIWHVATELCHYKDLNKWQEESPEEVANLIMSLLVSRYMLYLLVLHPSMLPPGIGVLRYKDTLVEAQKFKGELAEKSKKETCCSSVVKTWAQNLLRKEKHVHTGVKSCSKAHESTESRNLCEVCHLLLQVGTQLPAAKIQGGKSRSVLLDARRLAFQLNEFESKDFSRKWDLIGQVWAMFLIYTACQSKDHEHCGSLSRGGELLTHIWLLMAHLGFAEAVEITKPRCAAKLIKN